jgi:hypothetical protein
MARTQKPRLILPAFCYLRMPFMRYISEKDFLVTRQKTGREGLYSMQV